jgi:FolB domain-containing protein
MDQVLIKDLLARGIIGIYPWERERAREIVINVILFADLSRACQSDDIADSVNYDTLAEKLRNHAESAGRFTLEALAGDLAALCLEQPGVRKVRVRVEKPGAVRFTRTVGVEIERERQEK